MYMKASTIRLECTGEPETYLGKLGPELLLTSSNHAEVLYSRVLFSCSPVGRIMGASRPMAKILYSPSF